MSRMASTLFLSCLLLLTGSRHALAEPLPRIGIIGAGEMGGTLGRLWVNAGYSVFFASRHPQELKPLVSSLGPRAQAGSPLQAAQYGDVVVMAVPYGALPVLGKQLAGTLRGKVVLDVANPYPLRDGDTARQALQTGSGVYSARLFPGARWVRGFNSLAASSLAATAHQTGEEAVAVPLAGDDKGALDTVAQLTTAAGFTPVVVGGLAAAALFQPGGPLFLRTLTEDELNHAIDR